VPGHTASPACTARTPSTTSSAEALFGRYPLTPARTHCRNSVSSPVTPISKICTFGAEARTFRIAVRSSFMLPREVSSRMSASFFSKSSVRKGPALYTPATSIFPPFTNIRESASRSRRFSAATNTRGLPPAHTSSFGCATFSSLPALARRSPFERALFRPCSGTTKLCLALAFMAGHPPCILAIRLCQTSPAAIGCIPNLASRFCNS